MFHSSSGKKPRLSFQFDSVSVSASRRLWACPHLLAPPRRRSGCFSRCHRHGSLQANSPSRHVFLSLLVASVLCPLPVCGVQASELLASSMKAKGARRGPTFQPNSAVWTVNIEDGFQRRLRTLRNSARQNQHRRRLPPHNLNNFPSKTHLPFESKNI